MSNMQKIIEQGFFYDYFDRKCHISCVTDEYIVFKFWRRSWYFVAESVEDFEIHTEIADLYKEERKNGERK